MSIPESTEEWQPFPGGFKWGDIVSRRNNFDTPVLHGCVIRIAYDVDGEPLVIVSWPPGNVQIEAPEDLFKSPRSL